MKLRSRILACLLASASLFAGIASAVATAQTETAPASAAKGKGNIATFVVYRNSAGETACRVATPEERRRIMDARPGDGGEGLHPIYRGAPRRRTEAGIVEDYSTTGGDFSTSGGASGTQSATTGTPQALLPSAGLHIFLHGTTQLEANQAAKNAFIVAANRWEAIISTPINVVIDVDYGTTFFGEAYPDADILGQTGSRQTSTSFSNTRSRLLNNSPTSPELQLYNALPASSVPVETSSGTGSTVPNVVMTRANARAIGLVPNIANPDSIASGGGDAQIGFNSAFGFDFTPDDGIDAGKTDFDAVVTHEIGHALGFVSDSADDAAPTFMSIWDVFRFRPGAASLSTMATAPRTMVAGGTQVFFNAQPHVAGGVQTQELGLSTGGPDGDATGGDGRQSSHWKDDAILVNGVRGPYIGIMDPTIGSGVRRQITTNDTNALDAFGYAIGGSVAPPPPPPAAPANDNFVNAVTLQGSSGSVTGTNVSATKEAGEPNHADPGGASVWYFWTAPASGTAVFDTVGSNYDTTLAAYTGTAVNALSKLTENDDIVLAQNIQSRITFTASAGTTYRIAVDGFDADTGNIVLNWTSAAPPPPPASFSVTGRVTDPDGSPLAGVRIALNGPNLTNGFPALPATTDANGNYSFSLLTGGGNYSVTGGDSRYTFGGGPYVFNQISFNQTGVNFTATAPATVTGTVTENGQPLQGVAVGIYGFNPLRLLRQTTTDAAGRWTFSNMTVGQSYNTVFLKSGYSFNPPTLVFPLNTAATDMGSVLASKTSPIDISDFFVAQHYRDFLGREPDAPGLAFWTNEIESCGFDLQCRQVKRIHVSAAFFLSIEFQETGYLVERMYKVAYGDTVEPSTGLVVPVIRRQEFLDDTPLIRGTVVVGQGNWRPQLEANKDAYAQTFVQRQRFADAYPSSMTPAAFVGKLNQNAGGALTQAEADAIAAEMAANSSSAGIISARAVALRRVAENAELDRREKNRAFVLMQYYGYLRRNPNDAPEANLNFAGWNFWLGKLNENGGDFVKAEMVKAFLDATEYRSRFPVN